MKKRELTQRITSWITLGIFSIQPPLAFAADPPIAADESAPVEHRPLVQETANGIPLVQISGPTAGGVSRNEYSLFSVPERGAILNNSFQLSNTQLAGWVQGNPNMSRGTAQIIVNEVTGRMPSNIQGFLEVAGNKASVVIANPNGIAVNGGGFLNTSRALLTTGRPQYDSAGNLRNMHIERGTVSVYGDGLNANGADSVEILARAAEINAGLWANAAHLVTGANDVAYPELSATAIEGTGERPAFALDVGAVGGMYAGKITMVGTERGVGVNIEGSLSATRAISLDADGNIRIASSAVVEGRDIDLRTREELENEGLISARERNTLRADRLDNKNGGRIYGESVAIAAAHAANHKDARLERDLAAAMEILTRHENALEEAYRKDVTAFHSDADVSAYQRTIGERARDYDTALQDVRDAKDRLDALQAGSVAARDSLTIEADTIDNRADAILYSGNTLEIRAKTVTNSGARIESAGDMQLAAERIHNENHAFSAKRVGSGLHQNPERIRIDEGGHPEHGKTFDKSEFSALSSGYGAYHHPHAVPVYASAYDVIDEDDVSAGNPLPVGTVIAAYAWDDPIYRTLGVAPMETARPEEEGARRDAWDASYRQKLEELDEKITAHNEQAESYNAQLYGIGSHKIHTYTTIRSRSETSENVVMTSEPGIIQSGKDIAVRGQLTNANSRLVAGDTLSVTDGSVENRSKEQERRTVTFGTTEASYTKKKGGFHRGRVRRHSGQVFMTPQVQISQATPLGVAAVESDAKRNVDAFLDPFSIETGADGFVLKNEETRLSLPTASLYRIHSESTAKYLVETDPAFTNKKKFLSSAYMLEQMAWAPNLVQKRLGDGFFEQKILAEQILKATGKRYIDGYTDDETAFKALMDAGISYAEEMHLVPGISLTAEQIAALTADIVWLETRDVEVNGRKETVLYPVFYTKHTDGLRLTKDGSLLSAKSLIVETKEALHNTGVLYGEHIDIHAGHIDTAGHIYGKDIDLGADKDIRVAGTIAADTSARLKAAGNVEVSSTTEKLSKQDAAGKVAGIAVKGEDGVLLVSAGKDIRLAGAALSALGKSGSIILQADRDIRLDTKRLQSKKDMTASGDNYLRTKRSTELGTEIDATGGVTVRAGRDVNIRASHVNSDEGTISIAADRDVHVTAGREKKEDSYGLRYKESGLLSSTTTSLRADAAADTTRGTSITGQSVHIEAKQDASFEAANIIADKDVHISAGRDILSTAAEDYSYAENTKSVKQSGLLSTGGIGFTLGTQKTKTKRESEAVIQQGTTFAGLSGNVTLTAGDTAHLTSASVLAGGDAHIRGKEIRIDGKENVYRDSFTQESRTTGLTVSLSHGLTDLGQEIASPLLRMDEVQDDRLKAVYAWKTGRLINENFGSGQNALQEKNNFSLHLGLGASKTYTHTDTTSREYAGTRIASGGSTSLTAADRDLRIKGSTVTGKDISLEAKGDVRLEAGENTSVTTVENKSASASIGASFTAQGLSGIDISASYAKNTGKETSTTYTPTEVAAERTLKIESGKDTAILGSKAKGEKITARVGGNLHIETLQERETYEEKNETAGMNLSWNAATIQGERKFTRPTIGVQASQDDVSSHYRSAREQSGIFAGNNGFDIYVGKHTDLKGAVLASDAAAEKNILSTGTFSFGDLKNEAGYESKGIGFDYNHYADYDAKSIREKNALYNTLGLTPNISMPAKGKAKSTTKSAVAPAAIEVRESPHQDLSALSRDTENSLNELGRIFDKKKIEERQELARVFGEEAFRLAHNLKDDGSGRKILIHAIIGGIMSEMTGEGFASGAVGAGLNEALIKAIQGQDPGTAQIISAIIGAAAAKAVGGSAQAGASAAASGTKNNAFSDIWSNPSEVLAGVKDSLHDHGIEEIDSIVELVEDPEGVLVDIIDFVVTIRDDTSIVSDIKDQILQSYNERYDQLLEGSAHETGYEIGSFSMELVMLVTEGGALKNILQKLPRLGKAAKSIRSMMKYDIAASSIADKYLHVGKDIWSMGAAQRGKLIDQILGNNLGSNFPVVDRLENGVLTSIKSMDLRAPTYQTSKGIYNKIKSDVDKIDAFDFKRWGKSNVRTIDYHRKEVEVAIPNMKLSKEQRKGLEAAKAYAEEHGISMKITVIE
ncbi:hypothetical protein TAMA11512_10480 [Selenomonas sp. TAMA-11512]|uniref:two-partner secretion domain-containing protein n=1 Tax=Selenomonas sp. TAMA-11512 TaxID=3095337 RepID=UPI00308CD56E|nr:hypothetical protein TAMA11512_10480 [Selenomonas sp. TAMA-11512]